MITQVPALMVDCAEQSRVFEELIRLSSEIVALGRRKQRAIQRGREIAAISLEQQIRNTLARHEVVLRAFEAHQSFHGC